MVVYLELIAISITLSCEILQIIADALPCISAK